MKQIPQQLRRPPSVLKNPSVPLSPHSPQQRETHNPPKSSSSNKTPKTLEGNHHHIANTTCLNSSYLSLRKYPMPQSQSNRTMQ